MMCFKTTRSSESGYLQTRSVSDARPRRYFELGDSTHMATTSGMPSNFTLGDTKNHMASTSKQRKAGSPRETATRHSARKGDLKGSLAVSTDESRDRIKTGQKLLGAWSNGEPVHQLRWVPRTFEGEATTNCRNFYTLSDGDLKYPLVCSNPRIAVRLKESACAPA